MSRSGGIGSPGRPGRPTGVAWTMRSAVKSSVSRPPCARSSPHRVEFEFTLSGCARQEIQARQTRGSKEDVHCSARSTAGTEHCRGEVGAEERFAGE